jgi:hypothetical protein
MTFPNPHAGIDAANYEHDRRTAEAIRRNPACIEIARQNLSNWAARWGELSAPHREWAKILRMLTPAQLADFLESTTPKANRLRQSTPFVGVLKKDESELDADLDAA